MFPVSLLRIVQHANRVVWTRRADRMTNNWRRAMAAAAARQGHVAQAEAQNNHGNNSNNKYDDNDKVWACWAQPFVVTADSPVFSPFYLLSLLAATRLNAVCACVCEIHFSMSVTKTDKCPHSASLSLSASPSACSHLSCPFIPFQPLSPFPVVEIFYVARLNSRTV